MSQILGVGHRNLIGTNAGLVTKRSRVRSTDVAPFCIHELEITSIIPSTILTLQNVQA